MPVSSDRLGDCAALLLKSAKFLAWRPAPSPPSTFVNENGKRLTLLPDATDRHFAPNELAELWGVSTETIRQIFREEPGVLKIGKTGSRYNRGYVTLRIPEDIAERVHKRLSA
jgi:hypothetical protein